MHESVLKLPISNIIFIVPMVADMSMSSINYTLHHRRQKNKWKVQLYYIQIISFNMARAIESLAGVTCSNALILIHYVFNSMHYIMYDIHNDYMLSHMNRHIHILYVIYDNLLFITGGSSLCGRRREGC